MVWVSAVATAIVPLVLVYVFISEKLRSRVGEWLAKDWANLLVVYFFVIITYSHFAFVSNQFDLRAYLSVLLYLGLPVFLFMFLRKEDIRRSSPRVFYFLLAIFVLMLWIPMELKWVERKWVEAPIRDKSFGLPSTMYCAILLGMFIFTEWFDLDLNCRWRWRWNHLLWVLGTLAVLLVVLLPMAARVDFVKFEIWDVVEQHPWVPLMLFPLFLITPAIGEELIYRGVIQSVLEKKWGIWIALFIQAGIFGFAHINNKAGGYNFPNWSYVCFATIAGLGYGIVFWRTRSLLASASLHALVDLLWKTFFKGDGG
ncbi:MAG: CPBP family intramembrane metalloprotease [Candidatus Harrisonbacteria bacterium]|nr:CPBP family intramembrane metalloprotease [Candidatus Harrisonbacteria bacterium]